MKINHLIGQFCYFFISFQENFDHWEKDCEIIACIFIKNARVAEARIAYM